MTRRSFSVRYNESFLQNTSDLLSQDDLKLLSTILCDDPFANDAHDDIDNLFTIEWDCEVNGTSKKFKIWYVADVNVDHIEVIAITAVKDDDIDDQSDRQKSKWIKRIVRFLIRLMFAYAKAHRDESDDGSDGPDMIDFGP